MLPHYLYTYNSTINESNEWYRKGHGFWLLLLEYPFNRCVSLTRIPRISSHLCNYIENLLFKQDANLLVPNLFVVKDSLATIPENMIYCMHSSYTINFIH